MAPLEPFRFKQFHVHHSQCAHKVGTDGVLLGAWAEHPNPQRILDVGSGSGLISFMLAQRYPHATFVGIEQDKASINQARQSLAEGPFASRGEFIHTDFLKWETSEKFDLIVSNPPFFEKAQATAKAERDAARRQFSLPHSEMLKKMVSLLKPDGTIALVLPAEEANTLKLEAENLNLHLNAQTDVSSFPQSTVIRHLTAFGRNAKNPILKRLTIRNQNGRWSAAYRAMTQDFYL
jgi:tRNA1Val (adenine37-N6)-methyltransferase